MKIIKTATLLLWLCSFAGAQDTNTASKWEINGYLSNMQSVSISELPKEYQMLYEDFSKGDDHVYNSNTNFQNRLNLFWYANDHLTLSAQMRNRLIVGDQVRLDFKNQLKKSYENNGNFINPSWNAASGNSYILNLAFDRLYAQYATNRWELTIGKQRVNWGKTFAFNPNDLFNTYSYFDFDYEEKPGTDAIRFMYYTGAASSLEFAANIDSASQATAAVKWNANLNNYDVQFIGGTLKGKDLALGIGWSGYIKNASWRGELSWYQPFEDFMDTTGVVMLSTGMDFYIRSKWTVQSEIMLAHFDDDKVIQLKNMYSKPSSVKDLAIAPFQLLGNVAYQASPLSNVSLACIWYPHKNIKGIYVAPSWSYSLANNLNASVYWQVFHGKYPNMFTGDVKMQTTHSGFLRLKYNF